MLPQTALGGISREKFSEDHRISHGYQEQLAPTNLPDLTSLVASGRLQDVIKYYTKVMRKRVRLAKESNNSATV